jgi:hypothetical protein
MIAAVHTIARRVDAWFAGPETERRYAIVLSLFSLTLAARVALSPFAALADIPAAQFDPPIYLRWLDAPPPVAVIVLLQAVGTGAAIAYAVRQRPHAAFVVAWLALLVLGGLRASRGKILHPDTMILLACVPLVFAPRSARGARRGGTGRGPQFGLPLRTAMTVVVTIYFFTGYQKLVTSGIAWVTSDNLRWVMYRASNIYSGHAPDLARWIADRPWICTLIAASTIVFECGAPLTLGFRRLRPLLPVAATGFHTMIWLFYGLDYSMWLASAWILFIEWDRVADRSRATIRAVHTRRAASRLRASAGISIDRLSPGRTPQ